MESGMLIVLIICIVFIGFVIKTRIDDARDAANGPENSLKMGPSYGDVLPISRPEKPTVTTPPVNELSVTKEIKTATGSTGVSAKSFSIMREVSNPIASQSWETVSLYKYQKHANIWCCTNCETENIGADTECIVCGKSR